MQNERRDFKLLIWLGIIGILAFVFASWGPVIFGDEQQPEILVAPKLSKEEISKKAVDYIEAQGIAGPWTPFVMFQSDTLLSGYLQKNKLDQQYMNELYENYPIDYYQVELTHDVTQERYLVNLSQTDGTIKGWRKISYPEPASSEIAQTALDYLQQQGYRQTELAPGNHQEQHGQFVFQAKGTSIGDAFLELHVYVHNGDVSGFLPKFHIPQSHLDWQNKQQFSMAVMSLIAIALQVLMGIAAIVMTVRYHGRIDYRRGLLITVIYLVTASINNFNMYPAFKTTVIEDMNPSFGILFNMIFSQTFTVITAGFLYLSLVSGQAAWQALHYNMWARWREPDYGKHLLYAMGRGYLLCFVVLGVQQVLFWMAIQYFGMWSTNDPLFSTENLLVPALYPLLAWAAAISEEAIFRLFGIILFKRLFRNTFVAVLLSSMIWAIGHTSYPIFPAYTRFVEVTVLGLIFGWIYLRYGFITAVFTHASVNSILMAFSLFALGGALNAFTGLFYVAVPALISWILYLLHSRFGPGRRLATPLADG